jgi:hypothetical protein
VGGRFMLHVFMITRRASVRSRKVTGSMISIRSTALSCIVVLGLVAACGDDSTSGPVPTPDASAPVIPDGSTPGDAASGSAFCQIDGEQVTAGTVNAANTCEECTPETSATAWTQRADGTPCNPGQVCSAGVCSPQCFIDGVIYAEGAPNPANACETCAPATSPTTWTARASVPLLVGGDDVTAQGWTTVAQAPNTLTYGADYVRLETSPNGGGSTSGQLLITRAGAFDGTRPFQIRMTMQVESVNNHNSLDSGAAILGSFTPPFGNGTDRSQMIYLDSAAIGWADDTQSAAFAVTDGAYHVYELAVDAAKVATVSIDGVATLTRNDFTTNGTLAIGDQTNDPNVDGAVRIMSVEQICP